MAVSRVAKLSVVSATKQPCNARLFVPVTVAVIVKVAVIRSLPFCGYVYLSTKSKTVSEAQNKFQKFHVLFFLRMRTPETSGDQTKCLFIRVVVNDLQKHNRHNFMK